MNRIKSFIVISAVTGALLLNPSFTGAALGDQILHKGMAHSDVAELQELLKDNYYDYHIDGIFGPITREAVIEFQSDQDILVDGIVGPQTVSALMGKNVETPNTMIKSSTITSELSSVLIQGTRGKQVSNLQEVLKSKGYYNYTVDGIFGPITTQAVKHFQKDRRIQIDGIVGPQTFNELNKSSEVNNYTASTNNVTASSSQTNIENVVRDAKSLLGSPYVWGGTTPDGFDSSGFITYVFRQNGVSLPRTHREYWELGTPVDSPKRGDIVFFETYRSGPSHAGIYLGSGEFIHNSSSQGVIVTRMDNSYWQPRYIGAKRY